MREGKREMIGNLDAGNRLRDELVGCIRSGYFRKLDTSKCADV